MAARRLVAIAGHLAVPAGLYVAAAAICFAQLSGLEDALRRRWGGAAEPMGLLVAAAGATGAAVYLLDRVKLRDAWLDPADAEAQPRRYAFLSRRTRAVRWLAAGLLAIGAAAAACLRPWLAAATPLAVLGVLLYAGTRSAPSDRWRDAPGRCRPSARPDRGGRVKDRLALKNAYVAAGITGYAGLLVAGAAGGLGAGAEGPPAACGVAVAYLFVRVLADASLCDADDEEADRLGGTDTLPVRLGRRRAWDVVLAARLALAAALAGSALLPGGPRGARLAWAAATALSSAALRLAAPRRVRDWVDARFAAEAVAVWALLASS